MRRTCDTTLSIDHYIPICHTLRPQHRLKPHSDDGVIVHHRGPHATTLFSGADEAYAIPEATSDVDLTLIGENSLPIFLARLVHERDENSGSVDV
jgi:hypothetical protein